MRINLSHYSVHRKPVQDWYRDNQHINAGYAASMWGAFNNCPIIAIAFFMAEEFGYTPELTRCIDTHIETYLYDEILNQKLGSPYLIHDPNYDIVE